MRIFPKPIEIADDEGFSKHDIFKHKTFGNELANLFIVSEESLVVALDDNWGIGKTTFVKMWMGHIKNKFNCQPIYFDAFANDYIADPFTALSAALVNFKFGNDDQFLDAQEKLETFKQNVISVGGVFLKGAVGLGVRALTGGMLNQEDVAGEFTNNLNPDAIKNAMQSSAEAIIDSKINSAEEDHDAFKAFRIALEDIVKALPEGSGPLIFVVDELDRCKPTFALELVEILKHFFCVPGVHFLLSVNMKQLAQSVRSVYGLDTGSEVYLRKFVHLSRPLPEPTETDRRKLYIQHLIKTMGLPNRVGNKEIDYGTEDLLVHFLDRAGISLRDIDRAISNLAILIASKGEEEILILPGISVPLAITAAVYPGIYELARNVGSNVRPNGTGHTGAELQKFKMSANLHESQIGEMMEFIAGPSINLATSTFLKNQESDIDYVLTEWAFALVPPSERTLQNEETEEIYAIHAHHCFKQRINTSHIISNAINEVGRLVAAPTDKE